MIFVLAEVSGKQSHHDVPSPFSLDCLVSTCEQRAGWTRPLNYLGHRELGSVLPLPHISWETLKSIENSPFLL